MSEPIPLSMPSLKDVCKDLGMPFVTENFPANFRWPLSALARQARMDHPRINAGESLTFSIYGRTLVVTKDKAYFENEED